MTMRQINNGHSNSFWIMGHISVECPGHDQAGATADNELSAMLTTHNHSSYANQVAPP
jgi:hypothetical protein